MPLQTKANTLTGGVDTDASMHVGAEDLGAAQADSQEDAPQDSKDHLRREGH
jgi:hypothetical protein